MDLQPTPAAELRRVTKRFGTVTALDRMHLALARGQVTALLGPNGAGKTTTVRLMLGLARPSAGEVRLFDLDPAEREARARVGVMLQVGGLPATLTPREHVTLFRRYYLAARSIEPRRAGERPPRLPAVDEVLAASGVTAFADRRFGTLSGGQKQRVMFAVALCGDPELLFLDEPTAGLDVEARRLFWDAVRQLAAEGRSVLLTTHHLEEADALAHRVVVLHEGRCVADGSPAEVKRQVGGRRLRCRTKVAPAEIEHLPGVQSVHTEGEALLVLTSDAEGLARHLLAQDPLLADLEIAGAGLEEAFVSLTTSPGPSTERRSAAAALQGALR
jgi:ABC-2 type transport system ATP-binding protein